MTIFSPKSKGFCTGRYFDPNAGVPRTTNERFDFDLFHVDISDPTTAFNCLRETSVPSIPTLYIPSRETQVERACLQIERSAKELKKLGFGCQVLSLDGDGFLQRLMSPRTSKDLDLEEKIKIVHLCVNAIRNESPEFGVSLMVEELCPNGMDAVSGIFWARELENLGARLVIASGGTMDFPILKQRRQTQTKDAAKDENQHFESPETWLASALWLRKKVKVPIFAKGPAQDLERAKNYAILLGLSGIVVET